MQILNEARGLRKLFANVNGMRLAGQLLSGFEAFLGLQMAQF